MSITNKHISRRAVLKGVGATMALPLLEAMVPARNVFAAAAADKKIRFVAIEMVHGSAGSTPIGLKKNLWAPEAVGHAPATLAMAQLCSRTSQRPSSVWQQSAM